VPECLRDDGKWHARYRRPRSMGVPEAMEAHPFDFGRCMSPELHHALSDYAEMYRETYGEPEPVHELIPAILASFLGNDRAFARKRKA